MPHYQLISGEVRALPGAPARVPSWQSAAREAPGAAARSVAALDPIYGRIRRWISPGRIRAFRMPPSRSRRSYTPATRGQRPAEIPGGTPIWARIGHIRPEWQVTGAAEHRACCKRRTGSAVLLRRRAESPVCRDLGPWRVLR
jgi:hypothetical protein